MQPSLPISLLASAVLATALPQGGAPATTPTCAQQSGSGAFSWEIRDFTYKAFWIYQNPAHLWAEGNVAFTLYNPATGLAADCSAGSSQAQDFFYGNFVYTCSVPGWDGVSVRPTWTFAGYGLWRLAVNETWTCGQGFPDVYTASGSADLPLRCNDTGVIPNPDWKDGEPGNFYSQRYLTCDPLTTSLPATVLIGI